MSGDAGQGELLGMFDCTGRVAVVTGAAGTLGPVWADTLLRAGAAVALLVRPGTAGAPELATLRGHDRVRTFEADVCSRPDLESARRGVEAAFGMADILVANAGIDHPPTATDRVALADLDAPDADGILGTNLTGTLLSVAVFGGAMAAAGRGSIVLIGSQYAAVAPDPRRYDHLGGDPPFVKHPAYGATKAAVVNLARYFAVHWGPRGVRVNALSPGGVRGAQDPTFVAKFSRAVPLGRMAEPAELRGPLLFLTSDAGSFVTGAHLLVDGGYTAW